MDPAQRLHGKSLIQHTQPSDSPQSAKDLAPGAFVHRPLGQTVSPVAEESSNVEPVALFKLSPGLHAVEVAKHHVC